MYPNSPLRSNLWFGSLAPFHLHVCHSALRGCTDLTPRSHVRNVGLSHVPARDLFLQSARRHDVSRCGRELKVSWLHLEGVGCWKGVHFSNYREDAGRCTEKKRFSSVKIAGKQVHQLILSLSFTLSQDAIVTQWTAPHEPCQGVFAYTSRFLLIIYSVKVFTPPRASDY